MKDAARDKSATRGVSQGRHRLVLARPGTKWKRHLLTARRRAAGGEAPDDTDRCGERPSGGDLSCGDIVEEVLIGSGAPTMSCMSKVLKAAMASLT